VVLMTQAVGSAEPRFLPLAANIRKELKLLLEDLGENDSVLVALAGHGVQFRGDNENYFCPTDAKLGDKTTLVALGEMYRMLEAAGAGLKVLLVDACRNDPQMDNSRARATVQLESVTQAQKVLPPGGVVALFSCSAGEKAYEHTELKHGVFFHFVIEGLRGAAIPASETEILLPDLEKYVKRRVRDFVREKYGVRQMPEMKGDTRELVPLVNLGLTTSGTSRHVVRRVPGPGWGPIALPTSVDRSTAGAVASLLEARHLDRPTVDDQVSRKWGRNFLKALDPEKIYFLQGDIDSFLALDTTLDDRIKATGR
jgi:hypothetical protein